MFNCFLHNARSLRNKTKERNALLQMNEIDIGICVESWISNNRDDNFLLKQCCPYGFSASQLNTRGGGICLFYRPNIQGENFESQSSELFERCCETLKIQATIFFLVTFTECLEEVSSSLLIILLTSWKIKSYALIEFFF